jgi:hypothetical protein
VRLFEARGKASVLERAHGGSHLLRLHENVQVFGLAVDASMLVNRVCTRDDVRHPLLVQRTQRPLVELALGLGDPEVAMRDRSHLLA